jgi:hypothetical protein
MVNLYIIDTFLDKSEIELRLDDINLPQIIKTNFCTTSKSF